MRKLDGNFLVAWAEVISRIISVIISSNKQCRKDNTSTWTGGPSASVEVLYLRVSGLGRGLNDVPTGECRTLMPDHSGGRLEAGRSAGP